MTPTAYIDHYWPVIPGWCREHKRDWMRIHVAQTTGDCIDIGVWGGKSSLAIASALTEERTLWTIDPYSVAAATIEHSGDKVFQDEWNTVEKYTQARSQWLYRLIGSGLLPRVRMLEITDENACPLFKDNSIGFVHVDGNHGFESQRDTTIRWFEKLQSGGILVQDDTNIEPVQRGAIPAADERGERIYEDPVDHKWIAWRKR